MEYESPNDENDSPTFNSIENTEFIESPKPISHSVPQEHLEVVSGILKEFFTSIDVCDLLKRLYRV